MNFFVFLKDSDSSSARTRWQRVWPFFYFFAPPPAELSFLDFFPLVLFPCHSFPHCLSRLISFYLFPSVFTVAESKWLQCLSLPVRVYRWYFHDPGLHALLTGPTEETLGNSTTIYLNIWIYFNLIGNTILLPLIVLTFLFSKTAKRHPILINLCMTWIFSGVFSLLLYVYVPRWMDQS